MSKEELIRQYKEAKLSALENLLGLMIKTIEETSDPIIKNNLEGFLTYTVLLNDDHVKRVQELEKKIEHYGKS